MSNTKTPRGQNVPATPTATNAVSPSSTRKKKGKADRPQVGGSAVAGAKSTQPKVFNDSAPAQQQQYESYNRQMRRQMDRMGTGAEEQPSKVTNTRAKRQQRLKQRQQEQLASIKRSLPGGKVDISTRRVYLMVAVVAALIILLIVVFALLRLHIL
ncbi:MAG TPA: hypothetical protein VL461_12145 [Dictyobacter sp.]|jgi:hypothetical protein|nr:hypothetical protein [Dictyobacter sp.]